MQQLYHKNQVAQLKQKGETLITILPDKEVLAAVANPACNYEEDNTLIIDNVHYQYDSVVMGDVSDFVFTSSAMNGTAGRGQAGIAVVIGRIPANVYFSGRAVAWGVGLDSATDTAEIAIGVVTDNEDAFLPATVITALNSIVPIGAVEAVKSTAVRNIIAMPTVENVLAGVLKIRVSGIYVA